MKRFYGYVRVSTAKQGEGVSLQEQREAILRYAERDGLEIVEWFEEKETAAKRGRRVFAAMLRLLRRGKTDGVVIHKIDRSARNLRDWADLGELLDQGIDVRFASESLDLNSRGGRLSADIQAVVAADYIRNLREETRKGFYGRIKQGVYPLPAPLGYLDRGKGKVKEIDPEKGPLVRKAFELYGAGTRSLDDLVEEMSRRGLRNRRDGKVTRNGLSIVLNNPFYVGIIRLRRTGETFPGGHEPLVAMGLFDRVQRVLNGKTNSRSDRHNFLFRRLLRCGACGYSLTGERQKGRVYYRCHTKRCPTTSIREDSVDDAIHRAFRPLAFSGQERRYLAERVAALRADWSAERESEAMNLKLRVGRLDKRLDRLTDAFLDGTIEMELFERRKASLLHEVAEARERLVALEHDAVTLPDQLAQFLELAGSLYSSYESALPEDKRELVALATSNRTVTRKTLELTLSQPFRDIAKRHETTNGGPCRDRLRTLDGVLCQVVKFFRTNPTRQFRLARTERIEKAGNSAA